MSPHRSYYKEFSHKPLPPTLYIDTSFIVDALVDGRPHHKESVDFLATLSAKTEDQPIIIFSELLKPELRCAIISICIEDKYGKSYMEKHGLHRDRIIKGYPDHIKEFYGQAEEAEAKLFDLMQRFVHRDAVPITSPIIDRASKIMPLYRLGSMDAIHVATMEAWEIKDVVSYDGGFQDLPMYKGDCYVWCCNGVRAHEDRSYKRMRFAKKHKDILAKPTV